MKRFSQALTISIVTRMLLVCLLASAALLLPSITQHTQAATATSVTVNASSSLGEISEPAFGINEAAWVGLMQDPATPDLLAATGADILRWPGGSFSDA